MEHYAAWSSKNKPHKLNWSKPPLECYKVNFDAISCEDFSTQSAVCRNCNGVITKMLSQFRPPCSTIYGAALAAQLAGILVSSLQLNNFILEGVSNVIMSTLMSPTHSMDGQIEHIVKKTISNFPPPYGRLEVFLEVKFFAPFMWLIGPRQGFSRAAFPP